MHVWSPSLGGTKGGLLFALSLALSKKILSLALSQVEGTAYSYFNL
jgi:hypothetical protein